MMLLALGLGSQIGILEGMLCVIFDIDLFKRIKKQYMTGERLLTIDETAGNGYYTRAKRDASAELVNGNVIETDALYIVLTSVTFNKIAIEPRRFAPIMALLADPIDSTALFSRAF